MIQNMGTDFGVNLIRHVFAELVIPMKAILTTRIAPGGRFDPDMSRIQVHNFREIFHPFTPYTLIDIY
jgi:hypothetical protein